MWGTQLLASATALMRGQTLPPSEMKSLYGSTTSSAVMLLSYVGAFTAFPPALAELLRFADDQFLSAARSILATKSGASLGSATCINQPPPGSGSQSSQAAI